MVLVLSETRVDRYSVTGLRSSTTERRPARKQHHNTNADRLRNDHFVSKETLKLSFCSFAHMS